MRRTDPIRLAIIGFLLVLVQLAFYTVCPGNRAGVDLYLLFLFLATASTGPVVGGLLALGGGIMMDLYSVGYPAFHCFAYLVPVAVGAQLRAHMLTEFRLLGATSAVLLVLGKILAQFVWSLAAGRPLTAHHLLALNYWPVVAVFILVYLFWPWMVRQFPMPSEVKGLGR